MIDKWFLEDIENKLVKRKRVVVVDPKHRYEFLIKLAEEKGYTVLRTAENARREWQRVKDELFLRYEAEKKYTDENVIFYTTRKKEDLSFIFDYCFTHGCIDFSHPVDWLKGKLFSVTGLQVTLNTNMLITAAKLSVGKNLMWWKKILQKLEDIISLEEELLPFLNDPEKYVKDKDSEVIRLFEEKIFELLGQPYDRKPPQTLAKEVVNLIFNKLLNNAINKSLLNIYQKWLDSQTYSKSLEKYVKDFKLDSNINIWNVHPDHCFGEIDLMQLKEVTANFRNRDFVIEKVKKLKPRAKSRNAKQFVPKWLTDLITFVEFETKPLYKCNTLAQVIEFYYVSFQKVDRAIRNLYKHFINDESIIRPLQEYYESLNSELLQHWFEYIGEYKENQSGYLIDIIKGADPKTAIIVGDGIRYEMADYVADQLSDSLDVKKSTMLAGIPSETEHNMSILYLGDGEIEKVHKNREKKLLEITGKDITFKNLDSVNYTEDSDYLILTYKDIDSAGEKMQLAALKIFDEFEKVLKEKIEALGKKEYKVHLITDHGFVLTGLLDEADKIKANASGKIEIHERYIRTIEKQNKPEWIEFAVKYGDMNYVYVAKNHRPFKSAGVYGFAHGGLTPQEVIIPDFVFEKKKEAVEGLKVEIKNKDELAEVVGENFGMKIEAIGETRNLFTTQRKVQILLYAGNKVLSESNILTIENGKTISVEFSMGGNNKLKAIVIDAESRIQLGDVDIKKSAARDLNGLL